MNKQLITSNEYSNLHLLPFELRHTVEMQKKYGVWRWRSIARYDVFLMVLLSKAKNAIDIGGALAPLGFGSKIVDKEPVDILGNKVPYSKLSDVCEPIDLIFSSHCLEHYFDANYELSRWVKTLDLGGLLVLNLPSVSGWGYWHPQFKVEHKRIFSFKEYNGNTNGVFFIDCALERLGMELIIKDIGGDEMDNSIFLVAQKQ